MTGERKTVKGSIHDDRGTWVVRARVYNPVTGTIQQRTKSTGLKVKDNTKRKAERKMREIVDGWEKEANREVIAADPYMSEYIQHWIDRKAQTQSIKGNTVRSYQYNADLHILPALGKMKIREITLRHLQQFYKRLADGGLSPSSQRKINVIVSGALFDAVRDGIIPVNYASERYLEFPRTAKKFEGKAYNEEQVVKLLEAAKEAGEPLRAGVTLAVCYGLRRSEICGLRWSDIDFTENTLTVRNTVVQIGTVKIEAETTKTAKSQRVISLIEATIPYLKELKAQQETDGLILDKVCVWPDGKTLRPDYLTAKIPKLMDKAGLPRIRAVHDLRHTAATLLSKQASPIQVQHFLGHKDITTTMNIYTHLLDGERKATADIMGGVLEKGRECSVKCSESP